MQIKIIFPLIFFSMNLLSLKSNSQNLLNPMNGGLPGEVLANKSVGDKLYAVYGGAFTEAGRQFGLAVWDGKIWRKLPSFTSDSSARFSDIEEYEGKIYLGGKFSKINRLPNSMFIVRWNGRSYESVLNKPLDLSQGFEVTDLCEYEDHLLIGGAFFNLGGISERNLVAYDGRDFVLFDPNRTFDGRITQMHVQNGILTIAGHFTRMGAEETGSVIQFKGREISQKFGFYHKIHRMEWLEGELYAVATDSLKPMGVFNVSQNKSMNRGIENLFFASDLHAHNNKLYLSGFAQTSEQENAGILVLESGIWKRPLPLELSSVRWLESFGEHLIISGQFKSSGPLELNHIAQLLTNAGYVSGRLFIDKNSNCQFDARDQVMPYTLIEITPGPLYTRTDLFGNYRAFLSPGTYSLRPIGIYPLQASTCASEILQISIQQGKAQENQSFPLNFIPNIRDMKVQVFSSKGFRAIRGNDQTVFIQYRNQGSLSSGKGKVVLQLPSGLSLTKVLPLPDSITSNRLVWNFQDMNPGDEKSIQLSVNVPSGIQVDELSFIGTIETDLPDNRPEDNQSNMEQLVSAEEQFNEKQVFAEGTGVGINTLSYVHSNTKELHYFINFGNYSADTIKDVIVVDTIDLNLDMRYFQVTGSSHSWTYDIISGSPGSNKGIFVWRFEDINLLPNPSKISDMPGYSGFVSFKIGMNSNLTQGTRIRNAAQILYDYHSSHLTNEVWCEVNNLLSTEKEELLKNIGQLKIYPNPNEGKFSIEFPEEGGHYTLYGELGQLILQGREKEVDLSGTGKGLYFLIYEHEGKIWTQKWMIR